MTPSDLHLTFKKSFIYLTELGLGCCADFSLAVASGTIIYCSARASHCSGFSCYKAQDLGCSGFSTRRAWAQ